MKEFFGFGGYQRTPEGWFSWQHLTFVTSVMAVMVFLAVLLGMRNKQAPRNIKNNVIIWAAFLIDGFELFKIVMMCIRGNDPMGWITELPLFLCSIQLIAIPMAAFSKGRMRDASLDFVAIFGVLGAFFGTYMAAQNYGCYPVLSLDNVVSAITHAISGFTALYIMITGMCDMKIKNLPITLGILTGFCVVAYAVNIRIDYNYMFLMRGDGTPYDILFDLVKGNPVLYPLGVAGLFYLYIAVFYWMFHQVKKANKTAVSL